jgi:hypothetical protein
MRSTSKFICRSGSASTSFEADSCDTVQDVMTNLSRCHTSHLCHFLRVAASRSYKIPTAHNDAQFSGRKT